MSVEAPPTPQAAVAGPRERGRRRRRLPLWATVVLWLALAPLALVAGMRLFAWDRYEPFAIVNDVTWMVYLPAWFVTVVAVVGRRYVLAAGGLVIVVLQVVFMLPELTAAEPLPSWTAGAPTIRLFDANVYESNSSMSGYIDQIRAYRPTLVTMEETVPYLADQLLHSGALDGLPYRIQLVRYDPRAFLIASKYPLVGENVVNFEGLPLILQTTIKLPSGDQPLWVVHTTAPLPANFQQWKGQLAAIDRAVHLQGTSRLLVVGDFNATWGSKGFRTILDNGLADGAAARGDPFEMTWSQMMPPLRPFVRIDHVLTGPGVAVTGVAVHAGPGSDHRDVTATVAVQR